MEGINKNKNINKILIAIGCIVIAIILSIGTKKIIDYANKDLKEGIREEVPFGDCATGCGSCNGNVCSSCTGGYYVTNATGTGVVCTICPAGSKCPGGVKSACSAGTYQNSRGQTSCIPCPAGQYQDGSGQGACKKCPAGTYNNLTGQTSSSACKDCTAGYYCENEATSLPTICPAGNYCIAGAETPEVCPKGSYCPTGTSEPIQCPGNTFNSLTGQSSLSACKSCNGIVNDSKTACTTITPTSITINSSSVMVGNAISLQATVEPSNATQSVTWSIVSGGEYASLSANVLTGIKQGVVVVKATSTASSSVTAQKSITVGNPPCSDGYYMGESTCETCPAGYYCDNGYSKKECPTGKTSSLGAKSSTDCYVLADQSECSVSASTASVHVSIDGNILASNSYYAVKVTVEGNGCNGQVLKIPNRTNAKSVSPESISNISSGAIYYFNVYPAEACMDSSVTVTLTNGKSSTVTLSKESIYHDWDLIKKGRWCPSETPNLIVGSHNADNAGKDYYYDKLGDDGCYTEYWERKGCETTPPPSTPTEPENPSNPSVEQDACYMNNATGIYTWGKFKNNSNYTLISSINNVEQCNIPPEGGTGNEDPVYACYKDVNNNYQWAVTPPAGYTLVESIREEANCKLIDKAACYIDSSNKYVWGDYANSNSHKLVDSIKTADKCVNPAACYKDKNDNYVWGNYSYNSSYSLVSNITKKEDCKKTVVNVPSTAASVSTIIYISIAIMTIAGGSFIYYVYNKKNLNTK